MSLIIWNGQLQAEPAGLNRAMKFGDGFFETMRWYRGRILFLADHRRRMQVAARALQLKLPDQLTAAELTQQAHALAAATHAGDHARLRLTVFRSGGGAYRAQTAEAEYCMEVMPLPGFYDPDVKAATACIYRKLTKDFSILSSVKTIGSLPYVLAALYAEKKQCDEAILLNSQNDVVETTTSNVFLVRKDKVYTPPVRSGCIAGIFRHRLIAFLKKRRPLLQERRISVQDLLEADELFQTNAIQGIVPIARLGSIRFATQRSRELAERFYRSVG
ncbi:MAG: aminotransferase class IV [Chitinophagales bacterium]|nr:aminotransferase class IV [Chitinophagales bacterium]